jgi:hypothetical protein
VDLSELILYTLWEQYRDQEGYQWTDHRIRAEARGISLNARTNSVIDLMIANEQRGLGRLANTIRQAVQADLEVSQITHPEPERLDKVILGTIVRELGALSYEFSLIDSQNHCLFHGHNYFGLKPTFPTVDKFPHVRVHITDMDDLQQLQFLLDHVSTHHDNGGFEQLPMFG